MTGSERERARLEAYRDGELSGLARWRVERRLRRDPAARRALAELETLGALLRAADAGAQTPDLWEGIRLRLPALDARRAEAEAERAAGPAWRRAAGYLALGGAAACTAVLALVLTQGEGATPAPPAASAGRAGSVRWIDARGHPMMVLRDDRGATIIWVPERDI